jgi:hypothetical protein
MPSLWRNVGLALTHMPLLKGFNLCLSLEKIRL